MSDNIYRGAIGFIQKFGDKPAIEAGDAAGKPIRRFTIRSVGGDGVLISVTVWPEHGSVAIGEGDLVAVEGKLTTNVSQKADGTSVTYVNLSASSLAVITQAPKAQREVVNQTAAPAAAPGGVSF
jgi:hypothetical protein